jgi:hypothetical protein
LADRTDTYFAVRTSDAFFLDVDVILQSRGFRLWDDTPKTPVVGRLAVYKLGD